MFAPLPDWLQKRVLLQVMLIVGLLLGPLGNLGALEPLDGACASGCPCGSESDSGDPCDDEGGDHHDEVADHHDADEAADDCADCADDCTECDCDAGVMTAVTSNAIDRWPARAPGSRSTAQPEALLQGPGFDIFIPPRH